MNLSRRHWIRLAGGAAIAAALPRSLRAATPGNDKPLIRDHEQPMFDIPGQITTPVRIATIELLRNGTT